MTSPYFEWKRDGLSTMIKVARFMCKLINEWAHVIESKYAEKPHILLLLGAAQAMCELLPAAQAEFDAFGFEDAPAPIDPSEMAGINPDAPDAPDPEIT